MSDTQSPREIRQPNDAYQYVMGPYAEPIARVQPGEHVIVYTKDAFGGGLTREDQKPSQVLGRWLNPQTGPLYIEGAEPGDTLAVKIEAIEPTRDWAASCLVPFFGGLTSTNLTRTLQEPLEERVWVYNRTASGGFAWKVRWEIPWAPFFGTIGTAPAIEAISSLAPSAHGGNMDTPEMRAGVTCYLGVNVEGAQLSLGDRHARQGEGEACGVAVECAMNTVVIVELLKGISTPWPRIESDTHITSTGSARPLEDALRISQLDLVQWLVRDYGFSELDAYQFATQTVESPLANVCDTNYTCVAKIRKEWLPARETHRGLHARLRETATSLS